MRCTSCGEKASVSLPRHNSGFCDQCFLRYFQEQVDRALRREKMFTREDRVLVAVSGGKDSLALWDVLQRMGYQACGLYLDLGIEGYSALSRERVEAFARERELELKVVDFQRELGAGVDRLCRRVRRTACSLCGLSKRHFFNRVAYQEGFDVVATGHNLDDEAATLLGNVLHWQTGYLARQSPVLERTHPRLVKKVKPLFRLTERETAAYVVLRGIDYVMDECPLAKGARSLVYKGIINQLESESPGTKHQFLFGFLDKGRRAFSTAGDVVDLQECQVCGQPTTIPVCAFCRMMEKAGAP